MRKNCSLLAMTALLSFIAIESSFPVLFCITVATRPTGAEWRYGPEVCIPKRDEKQNPICVRDVTNDKDLGQFPREAELRYCWFFAVTPDNRTLASAGWYVRLWDLSAGKELPLEQTDWEGGSSSDDYCHFLAFTSGGKTLAGTNDVRIALWDARTGKYIIGFDRSRVTAQIVLLWLFVTLSFFAVGVGMRLCLSCLREYLSALHSEPLQTDG
ncbi:WD40 repeat domain-containing protein [Frigoriglobus tundricola]|nr:hypothetical protein [Frigoriglobus tundricola]